MKKLLLTLPLFLLLSCYKEERILTCATYVIFYNDKYTDTIRVNTYEYLVDKGDYIYIYNRGFVGGGVNYIYTGTAPYKRISFSQRVIND